MAPEEKYNPYHTDEKKLIEPFKTLNKGFNWLFDLIERSSIWPGAIASTIPFTYRLMMNILKARKSIVKGLVENTILTKKQSKKVADDATLLATKWLDDDKSIENGDRNDPFSNLEYHLLIIYFIRSNKSYNQEIHQYCDDDLNLINEMVNVDDDWEEWLSIAHHKRLNVLIEKYLNRFDKFKESKKYNGIWY